MGTPTKLPDGRYKSDKTGRVYVVRGGVKTEVQDDHGPGADVFNSPQAQANMAQWRDATGESGEGMRDAYLNAASSGAYNWAKGVSREQGGLNAARNPGIATAGAVLSPINKLAPGGVLGTGVRAAQGAGYADSIGENPYVGGLTAGLVSGAGQALARGVGVAGKLGGFLKNRFGQAVDGAPRLPATNNGTAVMGKSVGTQALRGGATEGGTVVGLPGKPIKMVKSPEAGDAGGFMGMLDSLGKKAGDVIQKAAVPVSEAVSTAQGMEDEENRKRYRRDNGINQ